MAKQHNEDRIIMAVCIGALVLLTIIITILEEPESSTPSTPSYRPYDMPERDWDRTRNKLKREFPDMSEEDINTSTKSIWEATKQRNEF